MHARCGRIDSRRCRLKAYDGRHIRFQGLPSHGKHPSDKVLPSAIVGFQVSARMVSSSTWTDPRWCSRRNSARTNESAIRSRVAD